MAILIERGYLEGLTLNEMIHSLFHFLETSHGQLRDYRFVWRNLIVEYDVSATVPNRVALMQSWECLLPNPDCCGFTKKTLNLLEREAEQHGMGQKYQGSE